MSTLVYSYTEPYKLPAGVLALVVHGAFFALLYFGVNWRTDQPQGMTVDIWDSLPTQQVETVKVEPPPVQAEAPKPIEQPKLVEPVAPPKADIELVEKKKPKVKVPEPAKPVTIKPVQLKKIETAQVDQKALAAQVEQERARAAQAAAANAITDEVNKYISLNSAKIRSNITSTDVQENADEAEFEVTLLPDGEQVFSEPKLVKSSGNKYYDEAVRKAIIKTKYFSLPTEPAARKQFISPNKLHLKFSQKE